ncbi:MAG: hypothetical protein HYY25_05880, partial [Candidatus Wallbacteria bacterium]|nr:hypothetical protein [Candidatus Wallbacteria bacterium]
MRVNRSIWALAAVLAMADGAAAQQGSGEVRQQVGVWVQQGKIQGNVQSQFTGSVAEGSSSLKMEPGTTLKIRLPVEESVKGAKFQLEGAGPMAPDATVQLKVNGTLIGSELPADSPAFDLGEHLTPGQNEIEVTVPGTSSAVDLRVVRVEKVSAPPEKVDLVRRIRSAFRDYTGREAKASELGVSLEGARQMGESSFMGRIREFFGRLFGARTEGFSRREVMDFRFARIQVGPILAKRLRHTPIPNLQILRERAKFTQTNDTNMLARFNAGKILSMIDRLDVPPGSPPSNPTEPPPAPPT